MDLVEIVSLYQSILGNRLNRQINDRPLHDEQTKIPNLRHPNLPNPHQPPRRQNKHRVRTMPPHNFQTFPTFHPNFDLRINPRPERPPRVRQRANLQNNATRGQHHRMLTLLLSARCDHGLVDVRSLIIRILIVHTDK